MSKEYEVLNSINKFKVGDSVCEKQNPSTKSTIRAILRHKSGEITIHVNGPHANETKVYTINELTIC